jgi:hypothetical protein
MISIQPTEWLTYSGGHHGKAGKVQSYREEFRGGFPHQAHHLSRCHPDFGTFEPTKY